MSEVAELVESVGADTLPEIEEPAIVPFEDRLIALDNFLKSIRDPMSLTEEELEMHLADFGDIFKIDITEIDRKVKAGVAVQYEVLNEGTGDINDLLAIMKLHHKAIRETEMKKKDLPISNLIQTMAGVPTILIGNSIIYI